MVLDTCRICGKSGATTNIFKEGRGTTVSDKITYCCSRVSVSENDGLPEHVCSSCEQELTSVHLFVLKCEATDSRLRKTEIKTAVNILNYDIEHCKLAIPEDNQKKQPNRNHEDETDDFYIGEASQDLVRVSSYLKTENIKLEKKVSKLLIKSNKKTQLSSSLYPCKQCDKKYKDRGGLTRHILRNHPIGVRERRYICEACGKGFFSSTDQKIHMRVHTGETPYPCSECDKEFTQIGAMKRHMKKHTGEKAYTCSNCNKSFYTRDHLVDHQTVHSDVKKFSCSICNTAFKFQNNLRKHMNLKHFSPNSFVCNYCGRTFNQKGGLKCHINRQHSEKSGICNVCSKSVSNIEVHMWKHTGQRPLKCDYCTSSFFEMKAYKRHINYRHKNTDKFECTFESCTMKFAAQYLLDYHVAKVHDTKIPYPCDRCDRGFYRKNDLARHKLGTHKERLVSSI